MKISVVIITYNPVIATLNRTLAALRDQTLPQSEWTLLVVDNRSDRPLEGRIDIGWHAAASIVREEKLGWSHARIRGILETEGDVIVFVDDDNILQATYLEEAANIARDWPVLGAWGGSISPEFEETPAGHLAPHLKYLALREVPKPIWSNIWHCADAEPWGAGLCMRRSPALAYVKHRTEVGLRIEDKVGRHGDCEMAVVTCETGLGMGLFPQLRILHLIPRRRVQEDYLVRLIESSRTSSFLKYFKWGDEKPERPYSFRSLARLARAAVLKRGFERRLSFATFRAKRAAWEAIDANAAKAPAGCQPFRPNGTGRPAEGGNAGTKPLRINLMG
jgi:glycosyltransferase involved in cell wall biosynthesis